MEEQNHCQSIRLLSRLLSLVNYALFNHLHTCTLRCLTFTRISPKSLGAWMGDEPVYESTVEQNKGVRRYGGHLAEENRVRTPNEP